MRVERQTCLAVAFASVLLGCRARLTTGTTVSACEPVAGSLSVGRWSASERIDAASGGSGTATWSPSGDFFVFYSVPGSPETLKLRIRQAGASSFGSPITVAPNGRTAHPTFAGSTIHAAIENSGTALVYTSTDNGESWSWDVSFQARDFSADPVFDQAFVLADAEGLGLFFGYGAFNSVVGSTKVQGYSAIQSNGAWPVKPNAMLPDVLSHWGMQGAFGDGQGTVLVAATGLGRSTDHGRSFERVAAQEVTAVAAAARNAEGSDVLLADLPAPSSLTLWKTADFGQHLQEIGTLAKSGGLERVQLAATHNLAVAVGVVGTELRVSTSRNGGCTWSEMTTLQDTTDRADAISAISLGASADGVVSLVYSLEKSGSPAGVFLTELR